MGFGGSEAPVLWTISALKEDFDLTLITFGGVDLERLNAYYGTSLAPADFSLRRVLLPCGLGKSMQFAALKGSFLQRYVRRVAPEFDLLISCYGPMDFGKRGIQMIADLSFVQEWRFTLHPAVRSWRRWWYGQSPIRSVYMTLCRTISGADSQGWTRNVTLANSAWTAELIKQKYGVDSQVLYPPVAMDFPARVFQDRENGFVCVGRVVPEKRVDAIIGIIARVRQMGHDVHLHVLGGLDDSPFSLKIKKLAEQNAEWLFLEGWAVGARKTELLARHRYGLHGLQNEAFGIAVGEMVNAGCIPFVPNGGGQVEIVDHPDLTFNSDREAVEKIVALLADSTRQESVRLHLQNRVQRFSPQRFQHEIRDVVITLLPAKP